MSPLHDAIMHCQLHTTAFVNVCYNTVYCAVCTLPCFTTLPLNREGDIIGVVCLSVYSENNLKSDRHLAMKLYGNVN